MGKDTAKLPVCPECGHDPEYAAEVAHKGFDMIERLIAERNRLRAVAGEMAEALDRVDAAMSFIEPRNEKAEYLETLEQVRAALAKWKEQG